MSLDEAYSAIERRYRSDSTNTDVRQNYYQMIIRSGQALNKISKLIEQKNHKLIYAEWDRRDYFNIFSEGRDLHAHTLEDEYLLYFFVLDDCNKATEWHFHARPIFYDKIVGYKLIDPYMNLFRVIPNYLKEIIPLSRGAIILFDETVTFSYKYYLLNDKSSREALENKEDF